MIKMVALVYLEHILPVRGGVGSVLGGLWPRRVSSYPCRRGGGFVLGGLCPGGYVQTPNVPTALSSSQPFPNPHCSCFPSGTWSCLFFFLQPFLLLLPLLSCSSTCISPAAATYRQRLCSATTVSLVFSMSSADSTATRLELNVYVQEPTL